MKYMVLEIILSARMIYHCTIQNIKRDHILHMESDYVVYVFNSYIIDLCLSYL